VHIMRMFLIKIVIYNKILGSEKWETT